MAKFTIVDFSDVCKTKAFKEAGIVINDLKQWQIDEANDLIQRHGTSMKVRRALLKFIDSNVSGMIDRFEKMITTPNGSKEYYILAYGDKIGEEKYNKYNDNKKANISKAKKGVTDALPSQVGYWVKRGFTEEEAKRKVREHQKLASRNSPTAETMAAWREDMKKKGLWEEWCKNKGNSLENLIKRLGEEKGRERHNELCALSSGRNTLEGFKSRYGDVEGAKKYKKYTEKIACTLENFIKRHGEEEGTERYEQWKRNLSFSNSIDGYVERYGEEGYEIFVDTYKDRVPKISTASKESRELLDVIYEAARADYTVYYGIDDNEEYYISMGNGNFFTYDLTILEPKIIVEYNGSWIHPRPDRMSSDDWDNWRNPYNGATAQEQYEKDCRKLDAAIQKGFTVFELWSDEDNTEAINQIIDIISSHLVVSI